MGVRENPPPPGQADGNDVVRPEGVHGTFRDNIHLNAFDSMAQETADGQQVMGRDALRRTERLSEDEVLREENFSDIKAATPVRGSSERYKVSKYSTSNKGA